MRSLVFIIFMLFSQPALAQVIAVTSGEHDGFSRLVMTFPKPVDWLLQRTEKGYEFSTNAGKFKYDLSDVYRRIKTNRLGSIASDGNDLQLVLNCACHAIPFELRPGLVVVDLKDGPAPDGSSFELNAGGERLAPLVERNSPYSEREPSPSQVEGALEATPQTVLVDAIAEAARIPKPAESMSVRPVASTLQDTRNELLWQLSKGAAEGVVEATDSLQRGQTDTALGSGTENIQIGAGIDAKSTNGPAAHMTASGLSCLSDDELEIAAWGETGSVVSAFSAKTTQLVGEFDRPNEEAVGRSVRFYLALGFGAEARQILMGLKVSLPDQRVLETMSYIVDLEIPPGAVFQGMEVCDTSSALWAVLALANLPPTREIAIPAILRSFSGLPLHLRNHLGPALANRFIARNDPVTARAIRDAILRAPGETSQSVQMLEAEIALTNDETETAEGILLSLSGSSSPVGIQSTLTLIEHQTDAGQEVSPDTTTAAEALLAEAVGGQDEGVLRAALAKAYASQNRFNEAFDVLGIAVGDARPVWAMLAEIGNDSAIMTHGIISSAASLPALNAAVDRILARRLLDLGFPDAAMRWLTGDHRIIEERTLEDTLLISEVDIARKDGISALRQLEGLEGEAVNLLRAKASALLQSADSVVRLAKAGQDADAAHSARAQSDWAELAQLPDGGIWQEAAKLVVIAREADGGFLPQNDDNSVPVEGVGQLALTRAALEDSVATRAVLETLLAGQTIP